MTYRSESCSGFGRRPTPGTAMNAEEILQQLDPWRKAHARLAWRPIVEEVDRPPTASKFAGMPYLADGESYPCCPACDRPMPLFVQLNLAELPDELAGRFGEGVLQLFYCTDGDCECDASGWEPFATNKLVRLVPLSDRPQALPDGTYPTFPAKTIVGWEPFDDYPSPQEFEQQGLTWDYNFSASTVRIECPEVGLVADLSMTEAPEAEALTTAQAGDKLAGYPCWVQGVEYPNCPECDRPMELVFQIDSEDNIPFMFGDVGCGHITQCPEHKTVLAFGWACG